MTECETETLVQKVRKVGWAYDVEGIWPLNIQFLSHYQKLEDEGFGMLEDKKRSGKVDESDSVVCPDGSVLTLKQIENYLEKRRWNYDSENPEDVKMHKAYAYYLGFKR